MWVSRHLTSLHSWSILLSQALYIPWRWFFMIQLSIVLSKWEVLSVFFNHVSLFGPLFLLVIKLLMLIMIDLLSQIFTVTLFLICLIDLAWINWWIKLWL